MKSQCQLGKLRNQIIEEYLDLGLNEEDVKFNPASDCVNLVCEIIVTDRAGTKIAGHIYKSFDKKMNATFIARYYND